MKRLPHCFVALALIQCFSLPSPVAAHDFVSQAAEQEFRQRELEKPLRENGFNPADTPDMLGALQADKYEVQLSAVRVLWQRNEKAAVPALQELLKKSNSTLVQITTSEALAALSPETNSWKETARNLLKHPDPLFQIRAAGLLAQSGSAEAWPIIQENLRSDNNTRVSEAAHVAPLFKGLRENSTNKPIQVFDEIAGVFGSVSAANQTPLLAVIIKIATVDEREEVKAMVRGLKAKLFMVKISFLN